MSRQKSNPSPLTHLSVCSTLKLIIILPHITSAENFLSLFKNMKIKILKD